MGMRTSDEPSVVGGQPASACSAPANILSQEEDEYRRAQLRREARSPEERTSSRKSLLRRSRHEMGGAYLRRALVRRRTACVRMLSSGKHSLAGER